VIATTQTTVLEDVGGEARIIVDHGEAHGVNVGRCRDRDSSGRITDRLRGIEHEIKQDLSQAVLLDAASHLLADGVLEGNANRNLVA
jgi:hypothetical protein